ncbi:MAG: hypothetical protein ABUT20_17340 [Bacteroidota bacterium]
MIPIAIGSVTQQAIIRVNVAGYIIIIELYKRWETKRGVSLTFISSIFTGRTINKSTWYKDKAKLYENKKQVPNE